VTSPRGEQPLERQGTLFPRAIPHAEQVFAEAYLSSGLNCADAYLAAIGPERAAGITRATAWKQGARWLGAGHQGKSARARTDRIRAYLRERAGELVGGAQLTTDEIVQGTREVVAAGLGKIPVRTTVFSRETGMPLQEPVLVYAPSLSAATAALGLQAKILGLVDQPGEVGVHLHGLAELSAEEREALKGVLAARLPAAEEAA
jgi:hypothetical protein